MHAGGDGEELDRLLVRLAEIRKEEGDTRDDFEVHVISYDAYTTDGIKRLEDKGVTDAIVGFRVPYIKGPDTEPLETKIKHLEQYAETVIAKVRVSMSEALGLTKVLSDAIAEAEELIANAPFIKTEADRLEGYDYLSGRIRMALQSAFDYDLDQPLFVNPTHQFSKQGLDNPDAVYFNAYLREGVEYVVRGRRGTSADLSFQVMGGAYTATSAATSLLAFDDRELEIADDGTFEFTYVAEPGAKTMIVREVFNDWEREERGTLTIERPDTRGKPRKALTRELLQKKYDVAARSLIGSIQTWFAFPQFFQYKEPVNTLTVPKSTPGGPGVAVLLDRPLRAGRGRGDDRVGAAVRRLQLPGDPDRVGLVCVHRLRDAPDVADQGPGLHRRRRRDAVRDLRAAAARRCADRQLAGDHRPSHRPHHAALAAARARPDRGRRPDRPGRQGRRRARPAAGTSCR